jgi:hypothetical protein
MDTAKYLQNDLAELVKIWHIIHIILSSEIFFTFLNPIITRCDIHFDSLKTILDAVEYRLLSLKS